MTGATLERKFVVRNALGLHARPAGRFVHVAGRFRARVEVGREGEWVEADSVLSLLSLAASQGTELHVRAEGEDAERAVAALGRLLESEDDEAAERAAAAADAD